MSQRHLILKPLLLAAAFLASAVLPAPSLAQEKLVDQVRKSIDKGVQFLRDQEQGRGHWEVDAESTARKGGWSSLAMLALMQAGVPVEDEMLQRGLKWLRTVEPAQTYTVGLQTMVFALAADPRDKPLLQRNADWLVRAKTGARGAMVGWGYTNEPGMPDNSNTQYALLGLHEALLAGAKVDQNALADVREFFLKSQLPDGGWAYRGGGFTTMTMTTAGLCNLLICGMDLNTGRAKLLPDGSANNCGIYDENIPLKKAVEWIATNFPGRLDRNSVRQLHHVYYGLYGIERAGRLTGERFFGGHDWYRLGCQYLVSNQRVDGSWGAAAGEAAFGLDSWPVVATSFSLLFLGKGRTPVLISKLAHNRGDGWNNKRSDMRHLTDFCSKELFRGMPLAWQNYDVRNTDANDRDAIRQLADELLPSPIVFLNHHSRAPSGREKEILKEYLSNGGFLFAEACCGKREFDTEFRALIKEMYPDNELMLLPEGHPIYSASGKFIVPAKDFPLWAISQGCKIVAVYSERPIAGYWEANDRKSPRGELAFKLGANIVAYATGLEAPKPRLTEVEVARDSQKIPVRRGFLRVAQLKHDGDWQPAPKAMRHLMMETRKLGVDVVPEPVALLPDDENVLDFRFFYMHGRKSFSFPSARLKRLQFSLENGGVLLADACCGSPEFDSSFREFINKLLDGLEVTPGQPKPALEPIPLNDELYSAELNGKKIEEVRCRREKPAGKGNTGYPPGAPKLEGVKINGRWAIIYSKYDLGCALERTKSSDCLGHDFDSAALLGKASILYALKR